MHRLIAGFLALFLTAPAPAESQAPRCVMSGGESRWIEDSFKAWDLVRKGKFRLSDAYSPPIILFDADCRYERKADSIHWSASPHGGNIPLPGGMVIPVTVTSFAAPSEKDGEAFFVMALPSVWRTAGITSGLGLEKLMTAVFLHEYMHTWQANLASVDLDAVAKAAGMADGASDDGLQAMYKDDPAYVAAYERERDLLYAAAGETDLAKARQLAGEAYRAMLDRQTRWFTGDKRGLKTIDDVFLTMEGTGQWGPYAWLTDARGGGLDAATAEREVRRGKSWWTQEQGLALFLVIDRLLPGWQEKAFAPKPTLGIDLLAEAVGAKRD